MAHIREIMDTQGDLIDLEYFCSDWCHQNYCDSNGYEYEGWNGCHEMEFTTPCQYCEGEV